MKIDAILKPEELHFNVPPVLAESINELIGALERDDFNLDCYLDEVQGSAREVREEYDDWIRHYYVEFGWMKNARTD